MLVSNHLLFLCAWDCFLYTQDCYDKSPSPVRREITLTTISLHKEITVFHIRKFSGKKISQRGWLKLLAVVAISAIFIASCSSDDDAETEDSTTTVTPSSTAAPTVTPSSTIAPTTTTAPPPTTTAPPPTTAAPTTTAAPPLASPNYDIAAGQNHTCTLNDGKVLCWGRNLHGQLGNGESGATAHFHRGGRYH